METVIVQKCPAPSTRCDQFHEHQLHIKQFLFHFIESLCLLDTLMFTSYSQMTGLRSAKYLVVMVRVISCKIKVIKMHTAWQIFDISDIHTPYRGC